MTDFGAPIIVLVLICVIMSGLLAFTNGITAPIIAEAERKANEEARLEVLPSADAFEKVRPAACPTRCGRSTRPPTARAIPSP